jgi:hypothetical protein
MTTFDRRRTNPPASGTVVPLFCPSLLSSTKIPLPTRTRKPNEVRKICMVSPLSLPFQSNNS